MLELMMGSRVRKSPFFETTRAAGACIFTVYNHMYLPISYGDLSQEYRCLTERVALWDVAAQRQIEIVGPDAAWMANYVSARDLTGLRVGGARYVPICDHNGLLINDPVVLRVGENRFWFSIADSDLGLWLAAVAAERGLDVKVFEPDVSPLAIQGPLAEALAADLFGARLVKSLKFFEHAPVSLDGIELVLCRSGWSKQGGFELFLTDGSKGVELWNKVMAAGDRFGIGPGAPNAAERIESGLLSFGADHDRESDPFEVGLGAYVDLSVDDDFIGKSALQQRFDRGLQRRLVNVSFEDNPAVETLLPLEHPCRVFAQEQLVGELRSTAWSPRLQRGIGIALIAVNAAMPGEHLLAEINGSRFSLRVAEEPFGTPFR